MKIVKESLLESFTKVVYHGSERDFEYFDPDKQGPSKAFFFSDSLEHAKKFSRGKEGLGFVLKVKIKLDNPLISDYKYEKGGEKKPEIVERAKKEGYDGLILTTEDLGVKIKEYIVFDKDDIEILEKIKAG